MTTIEIPEVSARPREVGTAVGRRDRGLSRRLVLVGICALMILTFVRGLFWVVAFPVWSGDEGAHYAYEQSVATGHGIPVAGRSLNSADSLRLIKESPVSTERAMPVPPIPTARWGIIDEQYEGIQSPLYYLLLVPAYWLGRATDGVVGSFYALRLSSLCLAVATIPLTALLGRLLLPKRRAVWLLAPAVIAVLQIVNVQNSYIDNDSLTMVASIACLLALFACRGDLRARRAALFGLSVGAALLTKATLAALFPALAIAMVAYVVRHRPALRSVMVWLSVALGTSLIVVLPYIVFNLTEYHSISGARAAAALVKPIIGSVPVDLHGGWLLAQTFVGTLFVGQGIPGPAFSSHYQHFWEWLSVFTAAAALAGAALHQRWDELATVVWIVVSIPLGLLTLIVLGFNQSGAQATAPARYLDCLLPLFAIVVGYGAVAILGSRVGSLTLLALLATASFLEVSGDRAWIRATYTADAIGGSIPAVEQSYADSLAPLSQVRATAACRVDAVAVDAFGTIPTVASVNGRTSAAATTDGLWTEYRLTHPVVGKLVITFSQPVQLGVARHLGAFAGSSGSVKRTASGMPALRLYCPVTNPPGDRFRQLFPTNHPGLPLGALLAWPEAEAWVEAVLVVVVAGALTWAFVASPGAHRRSRSVKR